MYPRAPPFTTPPGPQPCPGFYSGSLTQLSDIWLHHRRRNRPAKVIIMWSVITEALGLLSSAGSAVGTQLDAPTPCTDWTVAQVLQHAAGDQLAWAAAAGTGSGPRYDPFEPSGRLDGTVDELLAPAIAPPRRPGRRSRLTPRRCRLRCPRVPCRPRPRRRPAPSMPPCTRGTSPPPSAGLPRSPPGWPRSCCRPPTPSSNPCASTVPTLPRWSQRPGRTRRPNCCAIWAATPTGTPDRARRCRRRPGPKPSGGYPELRFL